MIDRRILALLPISLLFILAACGDEIGFAGDSAVKVQTPTTPPVTPPPAQPPAQATFVGLSSDAGDYIGAGEDYLYTKADSLIAITVDGARLSVDVTGDENWSGEFQLPDSYLQLEAGTYTNLTRYPFHDEAVGGLSWSGEGRGCNMLDGSITIDSVTYDGDTVTDIELSFEQYCEGASPALLGEFRWNADDPTTPPGPASQPPAGTWEPSQGSTPATGNFVYLVSEQGDFVGGGANYLYTDSTATITVDESAGLATVSISGPEDWNGFFRGMDDLANLEAGYYGDLQRYPFHNPVKGGVSWSGEGRGCNTLTGWFVVDRVAYDGAALTALDLRFEQHCEGGTPALYGIVSWTQ